ncbi:MAG: SDR family NAD(P)-dependent oxidoreductase [Streptosporangiaceae bacterium]
MTGANKGIGKAIVAGLARAGLTVFLGARDEVRGTRAAADLAGEGDVRLVGLDVTGAASVRAAADLIGGEFGRLDVLVNNAGVATGYHKPSEESADDLRYVYATNVFAVVAVTNAFLPWLLKAPAARIVNMTSKRGSIGEEGAWAGQPSMAYSSSKTALNAITVHYARELAGTRSRSTGPRRGT